VDVSLEVLGQRYRIAGLCWLVFWPSIFCPLSGASTTDAARCASRLRHVNGNLHRGQIDISVCSSQVFGQHDLGLSRQAAKMKLQGMRAADVEAMIKQAFNSLVVKGNTNAAAAGPAAGVAAPSCVAPGPFAV
jgi:hypothetical protein